MKNLQKQNRFGFGLGTIGRDMVYTLVSMYFMFYLTDVLKMTDHTVLRVTGVMLAARIFDALNDPIMGTIVDNTKTKWGKFKPWICVGAVLSSILTFLLFTDFGMRSATYVLFFAIVYVSWGIAWTMNDIAFWSMIPALSNDQKERERIGAFARISANIGMFIVVGGIIPITNAIAPIVGGLEKSFNVFALCAVIILLIFQTVTLIFVKEDRSELSTVNIKEQHTSLRGMVKAIFHNDQLLFTAISMSLFMIGYCTTTSFGLYYFKYAYKNENMYSIFAVILGISQIIALSVFPAFSKKFTRRQLYSGATCSVVLGYIIFFFAPINMIPIGIAGLLIFFGQAFIQLLMLVFLTDTVEYGELKLGKRNESVTFSLQPFINKIGAAIASGIVGLTVVISGINSAPTPDDVTSSGLLIMKSAMLILPLISIVAGYIVYMTKYKIDAQFFQEILKKLEERKSAGTK